MIDTYFRVIPRSDGLPTNDVMKSLLPKDRATQVGKHVSNQSPLHIAASNGHANIVAYLLSLLTDPNRTNEELMYETPLHIACAQGHSQVVAQLLAHPNTNPNPKDLNSNTPLHFAATGGHADVIRELLFVSSSSSSASSSRTTTTCQRQRRTLCSATPVGFGANTPLGIARASVLSSRKTITFDLSDNAPTWKQQQEAMQAADKLAEKFEKCCALLVEAGASVSLEEADIKLLTAAEAGDIEECRVAVEEEGARVDCTRPMTGASAHFRTLHENGK
eukprot:CAMPEP_0114335818 /NCGR_PEP_ID=MMETSP0101-20121206/5301_1 /TAXON_ID=38822 ORGANISM="Pteridomonas danica, Strain PT" /NCGR_SAMPLE_ID=MMETSP0101 /ASSEMBLY_ACC=CAM_ASM_000211 /LENGTH=276 /DNA_ID=CAMNT_0001467549 /DNA_START=89 /DNA_END=917 /DNA_ORIENTATION=-